MNLNQESIMKILEKSMEPGKWYEVKELIRLLESEYSDFTDWDLSPLKSEPNRPRWHRLVTNAVRLSPGRDDFPQSNVWVNLRTRKPKRNYEYSIRPIDLVEQQLVIESESDDGSGFVYAITNRSWEGWIKIGMTIDLLKRHTAYQMYSPHRDFAVLCSIRVPDRRVSEALAHKLASHSATRRSGEWFKIDTDIVTDIINKL